MDTQEMQQSKPEPQTGGYAATMARISRNKATQSKPEPEADSIVALAPLVMVAGPFGSGMEVVAEKLAQRMEVPFYDPHKLETLASDREEHGDAWKSLQDSEGSFFDYWLGHLHDDLAASLSSHMAHLSNTIREVAIHGGVIAGVCSHMVLPGDKLFRIRVEAGTRYCSHRLAMVHGIEETEARRVFTRLEEERRQFLHALCEESFMDSIDYDLVLDAETTDVEAMLKICLTALDRKGLLAKTRKHRLPDLLFQM